jgi:hypothetical protein
MAAGELMPEATAPTGTGPRGDAVIAPGIDYRRIQQPTELRQPWHIPSSGAANEAEDLAHALKTFGQGATHVGDTLNASAGKAAGAAAGADLSTFQPKTGLAAVTAYGANFNAAAHVAYVANTQTSIETAIDQAEQAYPHDPIAFQAHVQQVRDQTLKETPSLYQPEVQTMFDRRIEAGHNRIAEATIRQGQQDGVAAYTGTMESRLKTAVRTAADLPDDKAAATIQQALHDNATMVDGLVSSGAISKERAATLNTEFQQKITEEVHTHHAESVAGNWINTARTTQDITSGDRALASYVNDPANSNEDKARIGAEYARQREQFEHQQGILHAPEVQALANHIAQIPGEKEGRGASGPEVQGAIDSMRKQGWITTEYARSLSDRAALNGAKGQTDDTDTYNVNRVWNGEDPKFDPKDPKAGKAVDTFFKTMTAANGFARGTDGYEALAVSTMQHTSIIPPTIRKGIIADLSSGDPDRAAQAARFQERLRTANPLADIYQDDTKSAAFGDTLQRNLDAGMPTQQAYEMARNQTDPTKEVQTARKEQYTEAVKTAAEKNPAKANSEMLQTKLDDAGFGEQHWYGNSRAPTATPAMRAEYEGLTQEFYTRTGKLDQAQDLAFQQIQKTWHLTSVNGKPEIMKWGPTAAETPVLRAGIEQSVKALGLFDDPKTIQLTPFGGTTLSQGRYWNLSHANGDLVLDGKNQPVTLDASKGRSLYADRLAKQQAADKASAAAAAASAIPKAQAKRAADQSMVQGNEPLGPT